MARLTRKELKTDKFAMEVEQTVDYFEEHRKAIIRYGGIALVVVLIGVAFYFYFKQQHAARQEALAHALEIQEAAVGGQAQPGMLNFPTQAAKDEAALKAFGELAAKYPGSDEGLIAEYYLGSINADQGKSAEAIKHLKAVADSGNVQYASMARLSLGQLYFADGHAAQGEQLLRSLIAQPTIFVSKEQATLVLGRELAKTKPDEARKLIGPLRTSRSAVSSAALEVYGELLEK